MSLRLRSANSADGGIHDRLERLIVQVLDTEIGQHRVDRGQLANARLIGIHRRLDKLLRGDAAAQILIGG